MLNPNNNTDKNFPIQGKLLTLFALSFWLFLLLMQLENQLNDFSAAKFSLIVTGQWLNIVTTLTITFICASLIKLSQRTQQNFRQNIKQKWISNYRGSTSTKNFKRFNF